MIKPKSLYSLQQIVLLVLLASLIGCTRSSGTTREKPLARVEGDYLYPSDIKDIFPAGIPAADSQLIAQNYIEKWVRTRLMVVKAKEVLSPEQKNVEKQIDNYRNSLLIYRLEQNLLSEKLDTMVSQGEVEQYFNDNSGNFVLNQPVVKALYIKVRNSAQDIDKLRGWYASSKDEDLEKLEDYSFKYADKFDFFNNEWVYLSDIVANLPANRQNSESLSSARHLELADTSFHYFVKIREFIPSGQVAPLPLVDSKIRTIILNKRKVKYINEIENNIYNDGQKNNAFEIY